MMIKDYLIIGAGLSGLTTAYYLKQAGFSVQIVEAKATVGGRIQTVNDGEWQVDIGANTALLSSQSLELLIDELGIPYEDVVVSYFDSDTCVHEQYFAYLSYKYLTHPTPTRVSYQPAVVYNNNIWQAPAVMRVTAFATVFWLFQELPGLQQGLQS